LEVGDLGWRRIGPWCQLIAQFFDPPDARAYQRRIRRVAIDYAPAASGIVSAAPLLVLGWLAARLGWEPETTTTARGSLDALFAARQPGDGAEGEGILAQVRPRPHARCGPGELLAVTLTAGTGPATARFEIRASDDAACCVTRAVLPGIRELERMAPIGHASNAELLSHELERPGADPVYAASLTLVGQLVR
jgi:glucose-6-phosphate dehydrogenase assembly protein OpcA